jgi:hypothetical protein
VVNAALKKSKRAPQERAGGGNGPIIAATLAILLAAGAGLVALYALNVARDAKSNAAAANSYASRLASPPKAAAPTTAAASPVATTPGPTPSPTPNLIPDLRAVDLTIPPSVGCQSLFVDVDTGQWGNFAGHDFYFSACLGNLTVDFDNVDAAASSGGSTSVEACLAALAKSPLSPDLQMPISAGMTFCLFTSKEAAARANIPQRLAVVQIRQIAPDRTITLTLDTYKFPSS